MKRLLLLFSLLLPLLVQAQPLRTYHVSDSTFANPERGFYVMDYRDSLKQASGFEITPLHCQQYRAGTYGTRYAARISLIRRVYYLNPWVTQPIPVWFKNLIQADCDSARNNGMKLIVQIAYGDNRDAVDYDAGYHGKTMASLQKIIQDMDSLRSVFMANGDVIALYQSGWIGQWGEWNNDFTNQPSLADDYSAPGYLHSDTSSERQVVQKYLSVIPAYRGTAVRVPRVKVFIWGSNWTSDTLTANTAFNGSERSRIGFFNDAFQCNWLDAGTYALQPGTAEFSDTGLSKPWLAAESKYVSNGAETFYSADPSGPLFRPGDTVLAAMHRFHMSYENPDFESVVTDTWRADGSFDKMDRQLGYRFALTQSTLPKSAAQGGKYRLRFKLLNVGCAAPFNPRGLELILQRGSDSARVFNLFKSRQKPYDPRFWLPGDTISIDTTLTIPASWPTGRYGVHLHLPDTCSRLYGRPEYSIRLANDTMWYAARGWNNMHDSVDIYTPKINADISANDITLSWTAVPNVNGYKLIRNGTQLPDPGASQTSFTDANAVSILVGSPSLRYALIPLDGTSHGIDSLLVYARVPSASIDVDTTWSGTIYLNKSVTLSSGRTITVQPGTNVVADTGHSYQLTINGTLNAVGKTTAPITFKTRVPRTYGNGWNGISVSGANSSALLDSVIVRDATSGFYTSSSNVTIKRSTFKNNYNSIYPNGSSPIISSVLVDSSTYGIYGYSASPAIQNSTIRHCSKGIYSYQGSPSIDTCTINACSGYGVYGDVYCNLTTARTSPHTAPGKNVITGNGSGMLMLMYSTFMLGNSSHFGDSNSVYGNTTYDVSMDARTSLTAEYNYWGSSPRFSLNPIITKFDTAHALRSDPNPGRLGKVDAGAVPTTVSDDLDLALLRLMQGDFPGAATLYLKVLNAEPGTSRGLQALLGLIQTYDASGAPGFLSFLQSNVAPLASLQSDFPVILKQTQARWMEKAGQYTDAIATLQSLRKDYGSTSDNIEKHALFQIGVLYLNELDDAASAQSAFGTLRAKFPNDELTEISGFLMRLGSRPSLKRSVGGEFGLFQEIPKKYSLDQNYPNPFNPTTKIRFSLPEPGVVSLVVYDILGRRVVDLVEGPHAPGSYTTLWNATKSGSGVYFVRLTVRNELGRTSFSKTNKVLLLK